jgi:hypothetical protein
MGIKMDFDTLVVLQLVRGKKSVFLKKNRCKSMKNNPFLHRKRNKF